MIIRLAGWQLVVRTDMQRDHRSPRRCGGCGCAPVAPGVEGQGEGGREGEVTPKLSFQWDGRCADAVALVFLFYPNLGPDLEGSIESDGLYCSE